MKQHITTKQLDELSEKGKKRLSKQLPKYKNPGGLPKKGLILTVSGYHQIGELPLLSIGQMIEFLREHVSFAIYMDLLVISKNEHISKPGKEWHIAYVELCDALWEAVKEVLEK